MKKTIAILVTLAALVTTGQLYINKNKPSLETRMAKTTAKVMRNSEGVDYLSATAVFVENNIFLSAAHVCEEFNTSTDYLILNNGDEAAVKKVIYQPFVKDAINVDICVIVTEKNFSKKLIKNELASSDDLDTDVYIAGYSGGKTYSIRKGILFAKEIIWATDVFLKVNSVRALIFPGASGGGAFNNQGELIGIVVTTNTQFQTTGVTPLIYLQDVLEYARKYTAQTN